MDSEGTAQLTQLMVLCACHNVIVRFLCNAAQTASVARTKTRPWHQEMASQFVSRGGAELEFPSAKHGGRCASSYPTL